MRKKNKYINIFSEKKQRQQQQKMFSVQDSKELHAWKLQEKIKNAIWNFSDVRAII